MKLQVNNSGAWKNVLTFGVEHVEHVKLATLDLAQISAATGDGAAFRIVDSMNTVVLHTDDSQRWRVPRWAVNYEWVP